MKKKSIKDFMEEYETEELERLVLVKSSVSAIKTCLEKYWTANIEILAMADVCTGELVSDSCYLNWPLTDAEEQTNEYSNRFSEGGIYRVLVRMNKREEIRLKSWYVTKVLEENVSCPALEEVWKEYSKPVVIEDEVIGTLTMNKEVNVFKGRCKWSDKEISVILEVNPNSKATWTKSRNVMKNLIREQDKWDKVLRQFAAEQMTEMANEWLKDDADQNTDTDLITEEEFAGRIVLKEITVGSGGHFTAWYEDDDIFWGHSIAVEASLKKGPQSADIEG